jgi:hypothetical protein
VFLSRDGLVALRALDQQERVLDELRSRTGVLLAATALVVSFLGGRALEQADFREFGILALVPAIATMLIRVHVLAPRGTLRFGLDGAAAYEYFVRRGSDVSEAHRTLAYWTRTRWTDNQRIIGSLFVRYRLASGCLVSSIILLSVKLGID